MSFELKIPTFHPIQAVDEKNMKFAVIVAKYHNQWVFCRHAQRNTWEIPGGHVEPGETPLAAAKRELFEETGAVDADIDIVGAYKLNDYGLLCFADVKSLGPIPTGSEIAQIMLCDNAPEDLTYGAVHAQLFQWVQGWLNMQQNAGELWDVYDADRNLTGRVHRRGDFLAEGDYHLTVHVWIQNSKGQFLITKRSPNKGYPNLWECTGGSAVSGDDSLTAALREVREETGLILKPESGRIILYQRGRDYHNDIWLFQQDFDLSDVKLLEGETCDAMLATTAQIRQMVQSGRFVPVSHIQQFLELIENE